MMWQKIYQCNLCISAILQKYVKDIFLLFLRFAASIPFFNSGMLKISGWDSTLYLFEEVYQVPVLNFVVAAYLGTAAELILPIFIVLGLFTQVNVLMLFAVNVVAVLSYPTLWEGGFYDHKMWGLMLFFIAFCGAGRVSIDYFLNRK
jgi:putative oxidoreductase